MKYKVTVEEIAKACKGKERRIELIRKNKLEYILNTRPMLSGSCMSIVRTADTVTAFLDIETHGRI